MKAISKFFSAVLFSTIRICVVSEHKQMMSSTFLSLSDKPILLESSEIFPWSLVRSTCIFVPLQLCLLLCLFPDLYFPILVIHEMNLSFVCLNNCF